MAWLAWLVYIPLQIVWLPISIAAALWVAYKQIWRSRVLGMSQTAAEVINGRWTAHVFGLRDDVASYRLAGALPNNSVTGLRLALFPLQIARTIAGGPFLYPRLREHGDVGLQDFIVARSFVFDDLIAEHADSADQFVVLGAGLDARPYGPLATKGLAMFELDRPATQRAKREALKRAGLDAGHVHFVEANFESTKWTQALAATPYDPAKRSIFLWEGVTIYLSESQVRAMLAAISDIAAPGSVVILDLYGSRMLGLARNGATAKTLAATSESFGFGLDLTGDGAEALASFVGSTGYELESYALLGSNHKDGALLAVAQIEHPAPSASDGHTPTTGAS